MGRARTLKVALAVLLLAMTALLEDAAAQAQGGEPVTGSTSAQQDATDASATTMAPAPEATENPTEKPSETTEKPTEKPSETTEKPTEKPSETTEKPTENPPSAVTEASTVTDSPATTNNPASASNPPVTDSPPADDTKTVSIKFVNDLRYHLYPEPATGTGTCPSANADSCFGGLACLDAVDRSSSVWLHAGVSMGYGSDSGLDVYRLIKGTRASNGLKLLGFDALSVDADMFRDSSTSASEFVTSIGADKFACANCNGALADVKQYKTVSTTASKGCNVAVIGIISKSKADSGALSGKNVKDEIESIKEAVAAIKADVKTNILNVVVGEASETLAKSIVEQVTDVDVVLYSGNNIEDASGFKVVKTTQGQVYAALAPTLTKDAMRVGELTLTLNAECKPTASEVKVQPYGDKTQATCLSSVTDATKKQSLADVTKGVLEAIEAAATSKGTNLVSMSSEPCKLISCALGQLAADGVRAAYVKAKGTWNDAAARAAIIPSDQLKGALAAGPITDFGAVTKDDPQICMISLKGSQLWDILNTLIRGTADTATFPQLSGMWLDYKPGDDEPVKTVWIQGTDLAMVPVGRDEADHSVLLPCSSLDQLKLDSSKAEKTQLTLSQGLLWHLHGTDPILAPPLVEPRVRLYVRFPGSYDRCEDWTGMSVGYTLLVLGALAMVSFQGYQLWRFRSTLSYVR